MIDREKLAMGVAEFIGTFSLTSVVMAMVFRNSLPFFTAVSAGGVVALMTLVIGAKSGGHFNPAITIAMWFQKKIDLMMASVYVVVQLLGAVTAWMLVEYLLESPSINLAASTFSGRTFLAEIVGTFIFAFGIAAATSQGFKGLKNAVTIGGSLSVGILIAVFAGNGLLNPAVALGAQSWSLAYVTGPIIGAILGVSTYTMLIAPTTPARKTQSSLFSAFKPATKSKKRK